MLGRKAIHVDLNPLSVFWVDTLLSNTETKDLQLIAKKIIEKYNKQKANTEQEAEKLLKTLPLPNNNQINETGSDVEFVFDLFTPIQLANIALLKKLILEQKNTEIQNCLLLSFSSSINRYNRTYHIGNKQKFNLTNISGDSSIFKYYRHRIAHTATETNLDELFLNRVKNLHNAKEELKKDININKANTTNPQIIKGDATNLDFLKNESVDLIFTDPPYGSKIPYLDLSVMFNTWLDLEVSLQDREKEIIEKGSLKKTYKSYEELLKQSIKEMFRVLKWNRWCVFVFQHENPKYWHMILNAFEQAGFEYVATQKEETSIASFKKNQKHLVLKGQLNIYFKKVKTPKAVIKASFNNKNDITDLLFNHIEMLIAKNNGATIEDVNDFVIQDGMENGYLDILEKHFPDLNSFMLAYYDYNTSSKKFFIRKNSNFKTHIPLTHRIKYYLLSYLKRENNQNNYPTLDEIILYIMPMLKNGTTPDTQTITSILLELAEEKNNGYKIIDNIQQELFK